MSWTQEQSDQLRIFWAEGFSCSQIAAKMGAFTRNAVIGRVHRLGLARRARTPKRGSAGDETRKYIRRAAVQGKHWHMADVEIKRSPPKVIDLEIPIEQRKTLLELENHHCRYPIGDVGDPDFFFCGDPTADLVRNQPYCAAHQYRSEGKAVRRNAGEHELHMRRLRANYDVKSGIHG